MTGTVDNSRVRSDLNERAKERLQNPNSVTLVDGALNLNRDDIEDPFYRIRTTRVADLKEVYELFHKVLEAAADYEDQAYSIKFSRKDTPTELELPCFTGHLISRRPYQDSSGRKEHGPRFMSSILDLDNVGDYEETYLRRQTNMIQLRVWAKTGAEASRLAEWVEDTFFTYIWIFQFNGLSHPVRWVGRDEDKRVEIGEQVVTQCPLNFQIITGKLNKVKATALRHVAISVGIIS